MKHGTLTKCR